MLFYHNMGKTMIVQASSYLCWLWVHDSWLYIDRPCYQLTPITFALITFSKWISHRLWWLCFKLHTSPAGWSSTEQAQLTNCSRKSSPADDFIGTTGTLYGWFAGPQYVSDVLVHKGFLASSSHLLLNSSHLLLSRSRSLPGSCLPDSIHYNHCID